MNGYMSIQVRVLSAQATKQIRELEKELASVRSEMARTSAASAGLPGRTGVQAFTKWGNQVQWAGRQLQYNFTLPILLAGGAAAKFALDNEKAMTRVIKVYGDGSAAFNKLSQTEIPALGRAFEALSSKFGIAQADAINIAADWAAAGASGIALAKSVELTMRTMVLGEMEAVDATQALIAIQAQYGKSVDELAQIIDTLNMVENQTGISMEGLVQGFSRAAGVARSAGVDTRHLAAMLAAMVPAAGSAANAGNALKTMLSRLMSPTKEANEVFAKMGINTKDLAWQSLNATQRLETMAKTFNKLDDAQKIVVSTVAASRWQINRFEVLMRDIINVNGYYQKSLNSTADATRNYNQRVRELNAVLNSNPQRLKQIWTILQNAMADVIQPMIPVILLLSAQLAKLVGWFNTLDPSVQKLSMMLLLVLAAIGPVARYVGSVSVLLGIMHASVMKVASGLGWLAKVGGSLIAGPFRAIGNLLGGLIGLFGRMGGVLGRALLPAITSLMGPATAAMSGVMGSITAAVGVGVANVRFAFALLVRSLPGMLAGVPAMMRGLYTVMFASSAVIGPALDRALAYIYVFFVTTLPAAISRAYAPVLAASVRVWLAMSAALAATGPQILHALSFMWLTMTGFIARQAGTVFTATTIAFSRMNAAIVAAFVGIRRTLIMLPALIVWAMRNATAAVAAGARAMGLAFIAGMRAIPAIAAATWQAVLVGIRALSALGPILLAVVMNPWTYVIGAVLGLAYAFRDDLAKLWTAIQRDAVAWLQPLVGLWDKAVSIIEKAFWRLPASVRDAIMTVVQIIASAAKQVYEWFSYLNPFAHHSPSLVEQVTSGMAVIKDQYASVGNVGGIFAKAARDLALYKNAIAGLGRGPFSDERQDIGKAFPKLLPLFDALIGDLSRLNSVLGVQATAVARQQAVVDGWKRALDAADAALDREQAKLDKLEDKLSALNDAYASHQAAMEAYANAPLKGMGEMEDQIFANQQAQNQLRLEMLKWEQANGSIEDVKNNMALLAGSMERLRGEADDLRSAGAGADILGPINQQLADMQAQYDAMGTGVANSPISEMQKQLDELQRQGQILDLTKAVNFDPLLHEIDKLANAQKELTYDQIVKGITEEKAAMAALQPQIDAATAAVNRQEAAVASAKAARDAIQASYDAEDAKLKQLKDAYDATEQSIRDIESALRDMGGTASQQLSAMEASARKAKAGIQSPGAENFDAAAGGNFPEVGGTAKIGREGGLGDQSKLIDEFTAGINKDIQKQFGQFDMFKPIKDAWNKAWAWMETNVGPVFTKIRDAVTKGWGNLGDDFKNTGLAKAAGDVWDTISDAASTVWGWIGNIIDLFKDDFQKIASEIVKAGRKIWEQIGPELAKFGDLLPGLSKLLKVLWNSFKVVAAIVGGVLLLALKVVTSVLSNALGPVLDLIIDIVKNVIKILRGVIEFIVGVFTGDWAMAWQGIKDIVSGLVGGILGIFKNLGKTLWGIVKGVVEGVVDFFKWLWDVLVGHSIIPDTINAIVAWFKSLPGKVWEAVKTLVDKVVTVARNTWNGFMSTSKTIWNTVVNWIKGLPQAAYNSFIAIKTKLGSVASSAWNWFKTTASGIWSTTIKWIASLPQNAYNNIVGIVSKLREAGRAAFQALVDKAKAIIDGKGGFFTWISGIPGRIAKALGGVGSAVANAVKSSWNGAAGWLNDNAIGALNKVTSKFGFDMPRLPKFAGGGVIPGRVSKKDNTIIAARTGEGVIVPELVKAMGGARGLNAANDAAKRGQIDRLREMGLAYADGGIIGKVTGWFKSGAGNALGKIFDAGASGVRSVIPKRPFIEDYLAGNLTSAGREARKWGDKQEASGNGVLPGIGSEYQVAVLRKQFPGIIITSTNRPGAVTVSGNSSYHSMGRAVDMDPQMKYFDWIRKTYGKNTKELIYSPAGDKQIKNGQNYMYTGAVRDMHFSHVHWAYDKGGILPPGLTMAHNNTGKPEVTLTNSDWQTFSNVVSLMDRITQKRNVAGAPGAGAMARTGATLTSLEARLRAAETRSTETTRGGSSDTRELHFHGDLSFPNVENGSDAEDFIKHLRGLAG